MITNQFPDASFIKNLYCNVPVPVAFAVNFTCVPLTCGDCLLAVKEFITKLSASLDFIV